LSEVFDSVLELKQGIGNLRDENAELLRRLKTREFLKWDNRTKLYFADGDPDPFCPTCMDQNGTQIRLHPCIDHGQIWQYVCKVCKNYFEVDSRPNPRPIQIEPYTG
jgi:hypothetical protein